MSDKLFQPLKLFGRQAMDSLDELIPKLIRVVWHHRPKALTDRHAQKRRRVAAPDLPTCKKRLAF